MCYNFKNIYYFTFSDAEQEARNIIEECVADYDACGYSPVYMSVSSLEPGTLVVTEADDNKRLTFARLQVQGTGTRIEVSLFIVNIFFSWLSQKTTKYAFKIFIINLGTLK